MNLTIDHIPCDLGPDFVLEPGYDADALRAPERIRRGHTLLLTLPPTAANYRLLHSLPAFNAVRHTARLLHDGALLHAGTARLRSSSPAGYRIEIHAHAPAWARSAALGLFRDLPLAFSGRLTPTDIRAGWEDGRPVKFLPVVRDSYPQHNGSTDLQPVLRMLVPDDYHPFLHIDSLIRVLFAQAGYTLESRFMDEPLWQSLYMSGAYATRDTAAAEKRMGFRAVRLTTATAAADSTGRVYATPYGADNILGNLVETATPLATDAQGVARTDPYNNGNCFGQDGLKIVYRPPVPLRMGFAYRLRYTTEHRILTRDRLAGFDQVNLGTGGVCPLPLPNRYTDRRDDLRTGASYRVVVFDGAATGQYQLRYTRNGVPQTVWAAFTGRSALVTTPAAGTCTEPLLYGKDADGSWTTWAGDWALYDGHIAETGKTTVECTLRTPAEEVGPAAPKYFDSIYFGGAEEGMRLTLHPDCTLWPLFTPLPAFGTRLSASDVMRHTIRQQALLEAVQHLFNLRFYTDEAAKKVYIEPEEAFWDERREADWRGRTDFAQPVVWQDAALEVHESRIYAYRTGDGPTARLDGPEGELFGTWRAVTGLQAGLEGEQARINPLFSPTLSAAGAVAEAPSAQLMQVGDRDDDASDGVNFTPRIVRYCGLRALPAGERWPDPAGNGRSYPFAAFHFTGAPAMAGFTLCFGDQDGQQGLHRFYDREEAVSSHRRHVALTLRVEAAEYENLFRPDTGQPDLRWIFRISTDEGDIRATLRRIERYDPRSASARCVFTLLPHDRP